MGKIPLSKDTVTKAAVSKIPTPIVKVKEGPSVVVPPSVSSVSTTKAPKPEQPLSERDLDGVNPDFAPCMIHLDSGKCFKLHKSATIFTHIRKYLAASYEAAMAQKYPEDSPVVGSKMVVHAKSVPGLSPHVPQQENAKDCGVYMLEMVERVIKRPPRVDRAFIDKKGNVKGEDAYFTKDWFPKSITDKKRMDLLALVRELQEEERTAKSNTLQTVVL